MSNTTQHAPSPWKFVPSESGVRNNGGFICFLPRPSRYTGQDQRYEEEIKKWEFNASLIAAAPELLMALVQLHTVAATVFPPGNEKVPSLWREAIENARSAIEKATGN